MQFDRMDPRAIDELIESAERYEKKVPGLGDRFLDHARLAVDSIMANPETGLSTDEEGIRVVLVKRFPFRVIYDATVNPPFILAVYHNSRRPEGWKDRIKRM